MAENITLARPNGDGAFQLARATNAVGPWQQALDRMAADAADAQMVECNRLVCHYFGYEEKIVHHCASCGVADLDIVGNGTEKIEELVATLFPQATVSRLDLDAARGKHAHEHIIAAFENREVDILVGTQMVSKGLDFEHVNLVGVLQADNLLFQSGYKSYERAFQLLTQVSGRAGRKDGNGKVVIQTWQPDNPILLAVKAYDYMNMYQNETVSREHFHYPPYNRMIQLSFSDKHIQDMTQARASRICLRRNNKASIRQAKTMSSRP